jgi:hypothetical protein
MFKSRLMVCLTVTLLVLLTMVPSLYAEEIKVDFDKFKAHAGAWQVVDGGYKNTDTRSSNGNAYMELSQKGTELTYEWTVTFGNTTVGFGPAAGLYFLCSEATSAQRGNAYGIFQDGTHIRVYKPRAVEPGNLGKVTQFEAPTKVGETHTYKVEVNTKTGLFKFFRDGKLLGEYKDSAPYTTGKYISFRTGGTEATFKDVKVVMK